MSAELLPDSENTPPGPAPQPMSLLAATGRVLQFIRFSHTIFAMPFALGAMVVAARGFPDARTILLIIAAMITARTAAMAFNRVSDWEIDKTNPRTAGRHQLVSKSTAILLTLGSGVAFMFCAYLINPLCFALSPVALALVFLYSITKRFTVFTQFFLGLALAVSPVGAWLAVTGHFATPPLVLAATVLLWVAGFDLIYATQDVEFDRQESLKSMVVWLGVPASLRLARILHITMFFGLILFGIAANLHSIYFAGLVPIAAALVYEHRILKSLDIEAINRAFFSSNAFVGAVFVTGVTADMLCY